MKMQLKNPHIIFNKNGLSGSTKRVDETTAFNVIIKKQNHGSKMLKSVAVACMLTISFCITANTLSAQTVNTQMADTATKLYIDVHQLEPGKVDESAVAGAHAKDLAVQGKYGVHFIKYWVNKEKGLVYCLSSAADSNAIRKTHAEAHGLLPDNIYPVTDGQPSTEESAGDYYLDIHELGAGNVTADAVAAAHQKDLNVEGKHDVHFINYWVDEKDGLVMCLSKAKNADSIIATHKEAHGLLPSKVFKVKQGE